jgi:hypothetical protein
LNRRVFRPFSRLNGQLFFRMPSIGWPQLLPTSFFNRSNADFSGSGWASFAGASSVSILLFQLLDGLLDHLGGFKGLFFQ